MTEEDLLAAYGDVVEETDDPALFAVVRGLANAYAQAEPLPDMRRIREAAAKTARPEPVKLPAPSRRSRYLRRPIALLGAALILGTLAGGATYAMKGLNLFSGPHLHSSCSGTTITIAQPAYQVSSPDAFAKDGGTLTTNRQMREQVSRLQHPSYWVLPSGAVVVNTCIAASVTEIAIGKNPRDHTELHAFSVVPFGQSTEPTMVGAELIPLGHGCDFHPATVPVSSPDGRPIAQLSHVPEDLSKVSVLFTPCGGPTRPVPSVVPPSQEISFHVYGEVRYQGSAGSVVVLVDKPSPAAARPGLNLGNRVGALPDGTPLYDQTCSGDCPPHDVLWLDHGLIVSVSGDVPLARLEQLAADAVVR